MLLLFLTVSCLFFGSSVSEVKEESLCHGDNLRISSDYAPPLFNGQLYFSPSDGGPRKLLMDKGQSKDPRLEISYGSIYFKDVTERDDGFFSISFNENRLHKIITLQVWDCADRIEKYYGYSYEVRIPREADIWEFTTQLHPDQPKILWNRTNPLPYLRGRVKFRHSMLEIFPLTQSDSGYYRFRNNDRVVLLRHLLTVKEDTRHYEELVKRIVVISYPWSTRRWTVTFTPKVRGDPVTVMEEGHVVWSDWFGGRLQKLDSGIEINPIEDNDSGDFEFRDEEGYLALKTELVVLQDSSALKYAVGIGLIVLAVGCCGCCYCCCKKCCKKDESSSEAPAAPTVYYHDEIQSTGPSYSAAASVFPSHVATEPPTSSLQAPVYTPVNVHVSPSEPEVSPSGGVGFTLAPSAGPDFLPSHSEPRFELKGTTFPSAPPLSSNATSSDVYSSDKLNFL